MKQDPFFAGLAELGEGYGVRSIERELGFREELMLAFFTRARAFYRPSAGRPALPQAAERFLLAEIEEWGEFQDPLGVYAHCLCEIEPTAGRGRGVGSFE